MYKVLVLVPALLAMSGQNAFATGCMWYDEYEIGPNLRTFATTGEIQCNRIGIKDSKIFACDFVEAVSHAYFGGGYFEENKLPPRGIVAVTVDEYEVMHWLNCDGSDPTPEYVPNGKLQQLKFMGSTYSHFSSAELP